jgi:hypothetical protein
MFFKCVVKTHLRIISLFGYIIQKFAAFNSFTLFFCRFLSPVFSTILDWHSVSEYLRVDYVFEVKAAFSNFQINVQLNAITKQINKSKLFDSG